MNKEEIRKSLQTLTALGLLEQRFVDGEEQFKITEKGVRVVEGMGKQ